MFTLTSSANPASTCGVVNNGQCIVSNIGALYLNFEFCEWDLTGPATLSVLNFALEFEFDFLEISTSNGTVLGDFTGINGPMGLEVGSTSSFVFSSDESLRDQGFIICACDQMTPPPPTDNPTANMCGSDCLTDNAFPGCEDPACTMLVGGIDSFCTLTRWDNVCADIACANCGLDTTGCVECATDVPTQAPTVDETCFNDCLIPTGNPGCSTPTCSALVVGALPACGTVWDTNCVASACMLCPDFDICPQCP